jgi:hypothetical protein
VVGQTNPQASTFDSGLPTLILGAYVFRSPLKSASQDSSREFANRMDALLGLLDSIADALAAEWALRKDGEPEEDEGGSCGLTIQ